MDNVLVAISSHHEILFCGYEHVILFVNVLCVFLGNLQIALGS